MRDLARFRVNNMAANDGLIRMTKLLEALGNPEKDFKVFHIAGTNGKGSTACMIASILEKAGYSVGLFTSPHVCDFNERIQIWDGEHKLISTEKYNELESLVDNNTDIVNLYGELHYFEKFTAVAYLYFSEMKPDYIILECGLGGRLDSTNTIEKPLVSVITQIGLDHTAQLGNTIYKIAREKAGIIKDGVPVVSQTCDLNIKRIFADIAKEHGSEFIDANAFRSKYKKFPIGMYGAYQFDNAATAVKAIEAAGILVSQKEIEEGLASVSNPGRFEILANEPFWIVDGAHNLDAIKSVVETIKYFNSKNHIKKYIILLGCMRDKNYASMIRSLCMNLKCDFGTVTIDDERSADSETLGECFANWGASCVCFDSVDEAIEELAKEDYEAVIALGSIYLAGAIKNKLSKERV